MQMSWAVGFVSLAADVLQLLRCLLVNATLRETPAEYPMTFDTETKGSIQSDERTIVASPPAVQCSSESENKEREWERLQYRKICGWLALFYWVPFILGIVGGSFYEKAERSSSRAQLVQCLR